MSDTTPRSFSAGLLSRNSSPNSYLYLVLLHPRCMDLALSRVKFHAIKDCPTSQCYLAAWHPARREAPGTTPQTVQRTSLNPPESWSYFYTAGLCIQLSITSFLLLIPRLTLYTLKNADRCICTILYCRLTSILILKPGSSCCFPQYLTRV